MAGNRFLGMGLKMKNTNNCGTNISDRVAYSLIKKLIEEKKKIDLEYYVFVLFLIYIFLLTLLELCDF